MRLSGFVVLSLVCISTVLAGGRSVKSLVFTAKSRTSYVELFPQNWPSNLGAFTLCMRVATELKNGQDVILFAYRTRSADALNLWRLKNGRLALFMSGSGVSFAVPELEALQTHLCFTWSSRSGATAVFMNGKRSLTKIMKKSRTVPSGGRVLLGQDPDRFVGRFDARQSFVGEITDVNMWNSVLPDSSIQDMVSGKAVKGGTIFNWQTTKFKVTGRVRVIQRNL